MSASLKSIAQQTNLSVRTVAYILNTDRAKLFRPETRQRVVAAAAELGYRPNSAAKAMRTGRIDAVGLIQATRPDRGLLSTFTLAAIEDELLQRDMRLVMSMVPDSMLEADGRLPRILREWSVDGLMVAYSAGAPEGLSRYLDEEQVPAIWLNTKRRTNAVYPDDFGGARDATSRLLQLGHRKIGYLQFFPASAQSHYSVHDRFNGYTSMMREAGASPVPLVPERFVGTSERIGFVRSILERPDRPTAILAYGGTDHALPALLAARDLGLALGRDLSLVGFNDGKMSDSGVQIATMGIPTYHVGQEAVRLLKMRIESAEREALDSLVVKPDFYAGETFGAPSD
jgi:LacI family transcriptional regulator